jgi:hypothetical protein
MTMKFAAAATAAAIAALIAAAPASRAAGEGIVTKELIVESPTLIALGFEWYVEGDENLNAAVAVSYRKKGERLWRTGLPLLRRSPAEDYSAQYGPPVPQADRPNLFVGSIFDLEPNTEYETRLAVTDPDGVSGEKEKIVTARTRAEPMPAPGGRVFHVYPKDWKGAITQPAFIGVMGALYTGNAAADHENVFVPRAQAGDTLLVHAGVYKDDRQFYASGSAPIPAAGIPANATCCGGTFHGTNFIIHGGTPEKPIVIKGAGDGEAIFDGDGNWVIFNVMGASNLHFEGLTFRNTQVAIEAGQKGIAGASGITVKRSKFENVGEGIHTDWAGSKNFYIADNMFNGKQNPNKLVPWSVTTAAGVHGERIRKLGVTREDTRMLSQYAIKLYGSGHVVAYNTIRNFHDGVTFATYGIPHDWPKTPRDRMPMANDVYNNDVSNMHDDCVEVDGNLYNVRVLRNKCVNAAGTSISTQGMAGGPTYIVRNVSYHIPGNFAAIKTSGAPGLHVYNNTFVAQLRGNTVNSDFRNNLVLAAFPEESATALTFGAKPPKLDYNGYAAGAAAPGFVTSVALAGPPGAGGQGGAGARTPYKTLAEFTKATGQDAHSRVVDYSVFSSLKPAETETITKVYDPATIDFQIKPRSAAVDAGIPIPGVTDGFSGRAPDLGAYEIGAPLPHYGPRP